MADFFSGLVSGTMQGMDWREGRDNRKRQRTIEDERFKWEGEDRARRIANENEDRTYTREERARRRKEQDREIAQRDAELEAWGQLADEMMAGSRGDARLSTSGQPAPQPGEDYPVTTSVPLSYGDLSVRQAVPNPTPAAAPTPDVAPRLPGTSAGPASSVSPQQVAPVQEQAPANQGQRRSEYPPGRGPRDMMDQAVDAAIANARARASEGRQAQSAVPVGSEMRDPVPPSRRERTLSQMAVDSALQNERAAAANRPPVADTYGGGPAIAPEPTVDRVNTPAPVTSSADASGATIVQRPQSPDGLPTTSQGTPVVSVQAAAETAPKLSFGSIIGKDGPVKTTAARTNRAVDAGMKAYRTEQMPKIMEHYIRTGQLEKAAAFEKFMDDKRTKEGMRDWMSAIHALNVGDSDRFIDGIVGAYNSYYDDGYTALKDQSEFNKDENGNLVSATVAFRNDETGEVFKQTYSSVQDMLMVVIGQLSPEGAYDTLYDMHMKPKAAGSTKPPPQVTDVVEALAKSNLEFAGKPLEEQIAIAQEIIARTNGGGAAAPSEVTADDLSD